MLSLHATFMATRPAPPRHSEGQEAQQWLGQYSLALACAKRGAKGPLFCNSTSVFRCSAPHCLSLTFQLPRSCPSLRMWVGGSRKPQWTVSTQRCCTMRTCDAYTGTPENADDQRGCHTLALAIRHECQMPQAAFFDRNFDLSCVPPLSPLW